MTNEVLLDRILKSSTPRLFLPLNDHNQIDFQRLRRSEIRRRRRNSQHWTLIITHSPPVHPSILPLHDERIEGPFISIISGDDVVVTVAEHALPTSSRRSGEVLGVGAEGGDDEGILAWRSGQLKIDSTSTSERTDVERD